MTTREGEVEVLGVEADHQTRCKHYHSELDIIALKFGCCEKYYCCFQCHEELADHAAKPWPKQRFDEVAVICGFCKHEMLVNEYKSCNSSCPLCQAGFNPGCRNHYYLYFEVD